MKPTDPPVAFDAQRQKVNKNDPMMPVAWVKSYQAASGKSGRVFTTTMGASQELVRDGTRRLIVNACLWSVGLEDRIPEKTMVDLVGSYNPSPFRSVKEWQGTVRPADHAALD